MCNTYATSLRMAIIGGGVSGIAAANVLQRCGHTVTVYEKSNRIGGVWTTAYPQVRLQNISAQYHLSKSSFLSHCDEHPTAAQVLEHLEKTAVEHGVDVFTEHDVSAMMPLQSGNGWQLRIHHKNEEIVQVFDRVVIATGHFWQKKRVTLLGESAFKGHVMTEHDIDNFNAFTGKTVAVVGFGKSALDVATLAVEHAHQVVHVFRRPHLLIPQYLFGVHFTYLLFTRVSTTLLPSWGHASRLAGFIHSYLFFVVQAFWTLITLVFKIYAYTHAVVGGPKGWARLRVVVPSHGIVRDLRSAIALEPTEYYSSIASGMIEPYQGELVGLTRDGMKLSDGREIMVDIVILSIGSPTPTFPFLPAAFRFLLENDRDGSQLYRHVIHPKIPNVAFAGWNQGFLHIPSVEAVTLWVDAYLTGRMKVPTEKEMEKVIARIRQWKRKNTFYEPSLLCAVNVRFQQYLDVVLQDLSLSPYRKRSWLAEGLQRYTANDYENIVDEYLSVSRGTFTALSVDM